jgi:hypothetical protein
MKQYRTIFTDAINITNSMEEGKRPTTSYRNACSLHPIPLFNSSGTLYLYHTTANTPYHSQLAANFKCSNHPTFLLEGLSLQLDARLGRNFCGKIRNKNNEKGNIYGSYVVLFFILFN